LRMFEFGKTYQIGEEGTYEERNHLVIYQTGENPEFGWKQPVKSADFFDMKGLLEMLFKISGMDGIRFVEEATVPFRQGGKYLLNGKSVARFGRVETGGFDIKQPVYFADLDLDLLSVLSLPAVKFKEWSKFPSVQRDLALIVEKKVSFSRLEEIALTLGIPQLTEVRLFDLYMGEKLGAEKKSMALSFSFVDEQKTMTDADIDGFMNKIMRRYETDLSAEIRK
jgi:phenylalanyl-tRNA synthetase beta chain